MTKDGDIRGYFGGTVGRSLLIVALCAAAAGPAAAVNLTAGKIAKFKDKSGTASDKGLVKVIKDAAIVEPLPAPVCPTASSVRLTTNVSDVTRPLDCSAWLVKGSGFGYLNAIDPGGVQKILFKPTASGGNLIIKMKGDGYGANALAGPITYLEVRFTVGATEYCARFEAPPSTFTKNAIDQVLVKGPSKPCVPLPTATATATGTSTATATRTSTRTPTATATSTRTPTPTFTVPPGSTATATGTETGTPTPSPTPTETINAPPSAYRIDSLFLRDPHAFISLFGGPCNDATDPPGIFGLSVNNLIAGPLNSDSQPDGLLDLNVLAIFRPLVQPPGFNSIFEIRTADCTVPVGSEVCSPGANPVGPIAPYVNQNAGICLQTIAGTTGPGNVGAYTPAVTLSNAPCFRVDPIDITFPFGVFTIPLQQVEASATYVGGPATSLIDGTLVGFLSETAADAIILPASLPFVGGQPLSSFLAGGTGACPVFSDKDIGPAPAFETGWYFYLNFTAHLVTWTGS